MANINPLPDLSTVDIQAIQDSGPVHPLISLPPLTTIAANWDSLEASGKNLHGSGSETDSEEDEEEERCPQINARRLIQANKSLRSHSTSSSSSSSDSSDSEHSDGTSESSGSSSSTSDESDSDSVSSVSGSSTRSKAKCVASSRESPSFSVRETNYDKGRVTLRLSTLQQLDRKHDDEVELSRTRSFGAKDGARNVGKKDSTGMANKAVRTSVVSVVSAHHSPSPTRNKGSNIDGKTPSKAQRQLKRRQSPERSSSSPEVTSPVRSKSKASPSKASSAVAEKIACKLKRGAPISLPTIPRKEVEDRTKAVQAAASVSGPSLSDLDSDSDELYLPAVSEAIRMLDLDSQGPIQPAPSAFHQPQTNSRGNSAPNGIGHLRLLPHLGGPSGASGGQNLTWPSVGYCSSLLQQFVAKSQSGEPPPPPPALMLPTKGARKCYSTNEEPQPVMPIGCKRTVDPMVRPSFVPAVSNVHEQELEMVVPMRGLDCHSSHVSPDSGIQSVSGSPFSVHSSPVHPSTTQQQGTGNQQQQQQGLLLSSPCPPTVTPSPPPTKKPPKKSGASGSSKKSSTAASSKSQPQQAPIAAGPPVRRNSNSNRRPRSCRDTASALSSGMNKDNSIVQAIQRGLDAARRLTSLNAASDESSKAHPSEEPASTKSSTRLSVTDKSKKETVYKTRKTKGSKKRLNATSATLSQDGPERVEATAQIKLPSLKNVSDTVTTDEPQLLQLKSVKVCESAVAGATVTTMRPAKRKKKRKKHKGNARDSPTPQLTLDPKMQSALQLICRQLERCAISRSSSSAGSKHLVKNRGAWIFQCRKYSAVASAGSHTGSSSANNRSKRKKADDDAAASSHPPPKGASGAKRKSKSKKINSQLVPVSAPVVNSKLEPISEAAAAAVVLSAVELLLPLKKRHHHLAASESPDVEQVEPSQSSTSSDCLATDSNPSHDQVLSSATAITGNVQPPMVSSRKRPASAVESEVVNSKAEPKKSATESTSSLKKSEKRKGQTVKKAKTEMRDDAEKSNLPALDVKEEKGTGDSVEEHLSANKKKNRRRKTFNRTGFPSVKRKRKKPFSPVPPISAATPVPSKSDSDRPLSAAGTAPPAEFRHAKRARLTPKEDEIADGLLPEPASSEALSSDELINPHVPLPSVAADIPKKRKRAAAPNFRKRYLTAGLLSNFFKEDPPADAPAERPEGRVKMMTYDPAEHEHGLLPAPFYCERVLRRVRRDYQLPYDLWWLHQEGKLPGRDVMTTVPSWNYRKIRSNVYYDVKPPFTNDAQACNCTLPPPDATGEAAQCCGDDCLNRMVYTECSGSLCPVGDKCQNQRIQRHRWAQGLERFMTKEKGWGVRCRNPLKAGEFILEYVGEVVSDKEFKERMHTVYVHDTHHYCLHLDGGLVIDGHRMGGDGRFVNHSCAPNCEMQKWSVNGLPRMALFALRDISPYEELSYDYNFSLFNPAEGQACKCGSAQCRGVIGGKSQRVNMGADGSSLKQGAGKGNQPQKRKRKTQQQQGKASSMSAFCSLTINLRPLSSQQRHFVLQHRCFLLRNLDKVRDWRDRQKDRLKQQAQQQQHPSTTSRSRRFLSSTRSNIDPVPEKSAIQSPPEVPLVEKPVDPPTAQDSMFAQDKPGDLMSGEEVVRCRCNLFDDEGLMVQCERCETWQHSDCLGAEKAAAALATEHYVCDPCAGQPLVRDDLNIVLVPQPENAPDGQTFYLSFVYKDLQVRQGDCVYVLRDHDTPDSEKTLWAGIPAEHLSGKLPSPRPPHHLPPHLKPANLDIFQIERMWIDENGKQYVWGHHFFRPQDTFHEPSRKFYINELLYSPIQEAIPIWAVAGRCWVLDPTTFCKGRPVDAVEEHVYICEHRVDRTARLFSKNSRSKFPVCNRRFAFRRFVVRLKPQRTFQPHGAPPPNHRTKATEASAATSDKSNKKKKTKRDNAQSRPSAPPPTSQTSSLKASLSQAKLQEQKLRLDQLLRHLLIQRTPEASQVEDATHLLHRGRGRMRGRPIKQVAASSTSAS